MPFRTTSFILALSIIFLFLWNRTEPHPSDSALRVVIASPPTSLDPLLATDAVSQRLMDILFTSLVSIDNTLAPKPQLATWWQWDNLTLRMKIRSDLHFSDGSPVSIQDVKDSLDIYRGPRSTHSSELNCLDQVTVRNSTDLDLKFKCFDSQFMTNLVLFKVFKRSGNMILGSGPYKIHSISDSEVVLTQNPFATVVTGKSKLLKFVVVRDETTRYLRVLRGDVDIVMNDLQEDKLKLLENESSLRVIKGQGLNVNYLVLNLHDPHLKKLDFRKSIEAGIDRASVVRTRLENFGEPAFTLLAPINPFFAPITTPSISIEEARRIVRENGTPTIQIKCSQDGAINAQILSNQLKKIGLKTEIRPLDWGTFFGQLRKGQFQIALSRWVGIIDGDIYRTSLKSTEFPPGLNRGFYSNPEFDVTVEMARSTRDEKSRRELFIKAQEIVSKDLPVIPLWYNANVHVVNKRVKDFTPHVRGNFEPLLSAYIE